VDQDFRVPKDGLKIESPNDEIEAKPEKYRKEDQHRFQVERLVEVERRMEEDEPNSKAGSTSVDLVETFVCSVEEENPIWTKTKTNFKVDESLSSEVFQKQNEKVVFHESESKIQNSSQIDCQMVFKQSDEIVEEFIFDCEELKIEPVTIEEIVSQNRIRMNEGPILQNEFQMNDDYIPRNENITKSKRKIIKTKLYEEFDVGKELQIIGQFKDHRDNFHSELRNPETCDSAKKSLS
jgi:hypothetical protein